MRTATFLTIVSLLLIGCNKPSPKETFIARYKEFVLDNIESLPRNISYVRPNRIGLKKADMPLFEDTYKQFLFTFDNCLSMPSGIASTRRFLLYRQVEELTREGGTKVESERFFDEKNPYYMAQAIVTGSGFHLDSIGNEAYLLRMAHQYEIEPLYLYRGINIILMTYDSEQVAKCMELLDRLCKKEDMTRAFYLSQVLSPYLSFLSHGDFCSAETDKQIANLFDFYFPQKDTSRATFSEFVRNFKAYYRDREHQSLAYYLDINKRLKEHGFRLYLSANHGMVYAISESISIEKGGVGTLLFLDKIGLTLVSNIAGLSIGKDPDITVTNKWLDILTEETQTLCEKDTIIPYFYKQSEPIWKELEIPLTRDRANRYYRLITRKAFEGMDSKAIRAAIRESIGLHEVRHKWDEMVYKDIEDWYTFDMEICAHLTDACLGANPAAALMQTIIRVEGFYLTYNNPTLQAEFGVFIKESWSMLDSFFEGTVSQEEVRSFAEKCYNSYRIFQTGKPLPSLEEFAHFYNTEVAI